MAILPKTILNIYNMGNTGLDLSKLKEKEEELKKRGGGANKNWIQVSKITKPLDARILNPLPSMDGVYFVEVPVWWVNGKRLISKKLFGPEEVDVLETMKSEAESAAKKDKTLAALLSKKSENDIPLIQFKWEYWVPALQFNWELDANNNISGIYGADGRSYDVEKIKKFILDNRVKILVANLTVIKAINVIAQTRGNSQMMSAADGMNIAITKTGEKRDTKYAVAATEKMPMPIEFYQEGKLTDPFEIAQSMMFTDDYMSAVMGNYLYGDCEIPADSDANYEFPDIREALKDKFKDVDVEEAPAPRRRPGVTPAPAPTHVEEETPVNTPVQTESNNDVAPRRGRRPNTPAPNEAPVSGRRGRNLLQDLKDTQ
jgi:hypothetical protein